MISNQIKKGKNKIQFISKTMGGDIKLSGLLFTPEGFNSNEKYPTIVFTGPFNQIKEQMGALYGDFFSKKGFVFLTFDHQGYGESEGMLRNYEYFPSKVEGTHDAISFLHTLDFVNKEELYGLGACAGATHMAYVGLSDSRLKKIGFVSGLFSNTMTHFLFNKTIRKDLEKAAVARQKYYESNDLVQYDALNMKEASMSKIQDVKEGYDYYMTNRAGNSKYNTYSHLTPEFFLMDNVKYSARSIARYINIPTFTIYGTKASTKIFSMLFHYSKKGKKQKKAIKGASHVDLYDNINYVSNVVENLSRFFNE